MNIELQGDNSIQNEDSKMTVSVDESSSLMQTLTFSKWLHSVLVRPFGQLINQIVKMVYEALELEDIVIELDLATYSKKKYTIVETTKKRKLDQVESKQQPPANFKRRQLI